MEVLTSVVDKHIFNENIHQYYSVIRRRWRLFDQSKQK